MAGALITAATFPRLERRLLEDLRLAGDREPLAPKWVVVPSASVANHLRVRLASTAGRSVWAGVRVVNLTRLADHLSLTLAGRPAPAWHPLLDLTLFELAEQLPPESPLANLREISGGVALLRQTFTDLAEGGFGVEDLAKVESLAEEPEVTPRGQATLRLYASWLKRLSERQVAWAPLALQLLPASIESAAGEDLARALGAEECQAPAVFVYGFYEWIDVHLQWLAALAQRVPTTIYYPWHDDRREGHPAFSFGKSVLEDLRGRLGLETDSTERTDSGERTDTEMRTDSGACPEPAERDAVPPNGRRADGGDAVPPNNGNGAAAEFFLRTFPEGEIGEQPGFLSWQRASGIRAEALSAAVRVRRWLDDQQSPLQPEDILVVAPEAEGYVEAVQDAFAAFAIPVRVSGIPTGPTPEAEPLRLLARIWEDQAPAEWILALLRAGPDIPVARGVNCEAFESKVRELGIWGGETWRAARAQTEFQATDADGKESHRVRFDEPEKKLIEEILRFVPAPGTESSPLLSVTEALAKLRELAGRWLVDEAALGPLLTAVEAMAEAAPQLKIERRQWTRLLAESAEAKTQADPLTRAVLFLPLMRARGLTAKAVVVLGLAAGQLPHRVADDPLLSEGASLKIAQIAAQIGHRLPIKTRVTEEMLLLFFLINTAADRVHWVVPETDAAGKSLAPTPWVQRYLQRWERQDHGQVSHHGRTDSGDAVPPNGRRTDGGDAVLPNDLFSQRIARSPALQATYLAGLDANRGGYLPPALALFVDAELAARCGTAAVEAHLLESLDKRGRELAWSGGLGVRPQFHDNAISVTRLEGLARCPFRFYAEVVARWQPLAALSLAHNLDVLAQGTLLHRLLEQAVRPHLNQQPLSAIAAELLANDAAALWRLARQVARSAPEAAVALAMLLPVFREAALHDVVCRAASYLAWAAASPAVPQQVEANFRRPFPGLAGVAVQGKIDRLDRHGAATEVIDFKSGKYPLDYRKRVRLGWQIQAALYPWLCQQPDATFRYVFLGKDRVRDGDAQDAPAAAELLGELAPIIAQGAFLPTSNQAMTALGTERLSPCDYCQLASACRRFESGSAAKHAALFAQVAGARCAAIVAAGKPAK